MSSLRGVVHNITTDIIEVATNNNIVTRNLRALQINDYSYINIKIFGSIVAVILCIKILIAIVYDMKKINEKKHTPRISEQIYNGLPPPFILSSPANGDMNVTINYDSLRTYNKKNAVKINKKYRKQSYSYDTIIPINI